MKVLVLRFIVLLALGRARAEVAVVVPTSSLVYTPNLDGAIIQTNHLGERIVYSNAENDAYASVSPVLQRVIPLPYTAHSVDVPISTAVASPLAYEPSFVVAI